MNRALAAFVSATVLRVAAPSTAERTYSVILDSEPIGASLILRTMGFRFGA